MKSILYIGPGYFNYDFYILQELKKKYKTTYINSEELKRCHSFVYYCLWHLRLKRLISYIISKDIKAKINNSPKDINIVFSIKASNLELEHIELLKRRYPTAEFKVFLWDDFQRIENKEVINTFAPNIFSFDPIDCDNYGFIFRPLFYINKTIETEKSEKLYCVSFIGSEHSDRYRWLSKIRDICKERHLSYFIKIRLTIGQYLKTRFSKQSPFHKNRDLFFWRAIPYNRFISITATSETVVDFPFCSQHGLTMRSIETLALGVKLITTNKTILRHKDIPRDMYYLIDDNFDEEKFTSFIQSPHSSGILPPKYSIEFFINDILNTNKEK